MFLRKILVRTKLLLNSGVRTLLYRNIQTICAVRKVYVYHSVEVVLKDIRPPCLKFLDPSNKLLLRDNSSTR